MQINKLSQNRFEKIQTPNSQFTGNYSKNTFMKNPQNQVAFKGIASKAYDGVTEVLAKGLGKLVNTKFTRNTVNFLSGKSEGKVAGAISRAINVKDKWFQHAIALESIYLTSFYMYNTKKSKAIPEDQKRPMMVNQALVTTLCTALGYTIDSKISKVFNKAKHIFTVSNVIKIAEKMKPQVEKAIKKAKNAGEIKAAIKAPLKDANGTANGISKLKSVLVFGFIYRYFSPVFITPIANRVSELFENKSAKNIKSNAQFKTNFQSNVKFSSAKKDSSVKA